MTRMSLRFFGLVFFLSFGWAVGSYNSCAKIHPDSIKHIPVELGKNFTAVCALDEGSKYIADDITWFFGNVSVPRKSYTKINNSAIAVTVNISKDMNSPLKCKASKQTLSYEESCIYGIYLDKGYPPLKPKDIKCIAPQDHNNISPNLSCSWDPGKRDPIIPTSYSLHIRNCIKESATVSKSLTNHATINLDLFPNHMTVAIWVEAQNELGTAKSDNSTVCVDAEEFVKPNPPANIRLIPEDGFPRSLMVNWTHPIHSAVFKVKYHIRYCQADCSIWKEVSLNLTRAYIESFRLQSLQPYTHYVVQMRCKNADDLGYWSEWSPNATARTPENRPESRPDLWRVYEEDSDKTDVKLIWKDPVKSNGKILGYNITINQSVHSERRFVSSNEHKFSLNGAVAFIRITAVNSVGDSPSAILMIQRPGMKLPPGVENMNYVVHDGQLWVNWLPPSNKHLSEYVIEWVSVPEKEFGWQRVANSASNVSLKELKPYKRYNISVYPIYRDSRKFPHLGTQVTIQAYLQQGSPLSGPVVNVTATAKTSAHLQWNEIPIDDQRGFLINHTIFYKTGNNKQSVVVPSNTYSYKLTGLASNSHYVVYIMVSNQDGSKEGPYSSFHTKKYDDGEIDVIVVVVCLSFLFCVLFIMCIIIKKRASLKKRFWPQVPDPSHSTIANWSPDCPNKPDTPKEGLLAEVSVVEVDIDDGKSLCDEDKAVMPFKKYFSEERSSGIGGSSGMSTPRQSVSSNDEADSGQTTASTVQYSAVVGSGYKGQTPGTPAAMFSRSESTQPLLECEENSENLSEASSHNTNSYFKRRRGLEQLHMDEGEEPSFGSLSFSPMEEEDSPTLTEDPPGPAPSYMPQQTGYRPQ